MYSIVDRPEYMRRLVAFKDTDVVKIVTGIRRCGKSTLLELFKAYLLDNGVMQEQIIHMNMESVRYQEYLDYISFYKYVSSNIQTGEKYYLLFDELQVVSQWERAVESFRLDFNVDIYITGSNSYMLSSEFSTLLSGRYVEIKMLPLSFKEFLTFHEFTPDASMDIRFQKYLQFGGMPILRQFQLNEARSLEALEGIFNTVILRDVLERNKASDQALLYKLITFLCGNIGSLTSPNSIGNMLTMEGDIQNIKRKSNTGIAGRTVDKYIEMLKKAFILYPVARYDVKGKQLLKTLEKNYVVDLGFRNMLLGFRDTDRGHILENIIYLELLRRDFRVYIGKVGETEVDFIAENPSRKMYIQVAETVVGDRVRERELRPLKLINDNYPKIVLSMDKNYITDHEGILFQNIIDFLLAE